MEMMHLHWIENGNWEAFASDCKITLPKTVTPLRMQVSKSEHLKMGDGLES
jgi:hypothetical protein